MTRRGPEAKIEIAIEKDRWQPSLLPGPIVLVSSSNALGQPHTARKSWLTMAASRPPMLALCCRLSHRTAINILETRAFVINVPGEELIARVWRAGDDVASGLEEGQDPAWTYVPAVKVAAPRVLECRGHVECALDSTKRLTDAEIMFFGRIVSVSVDESLLSGDPRERYRALRGLVYLEPDLYGVIDTARKLKE